jgi:hypothetical protein
MISMETTTPRMEPLLVKITKFQPLEEEEHVSKIFEEAGNIIDLEISFPNLKLKGKDQMETKEEEREEGEYEEKLSKKPERKTMIVKREEVTNKDKLMGT